MMNPIREVSTKVVSEYRKQITRKLMMIDAFIVFTVLTGIAQVLNVIIYLVKI